MSITKVYILPEQSSSPESVEYSLEVLYKAEVRQLPQVNS